MISEKYLADKWQFLKAQLALCMPDKYSLCVDPVEYGLVFQHALTCKNFMHQGENLECTHLCM